MKRRSVPHPGGAGHPFTTHSAFSLLEVILVIGLLLLVSAMVVPNLFLHWREEQLPTSAKRLRSLVQMTRANAMIDGKRYRLRLPRKDELDCEGTDVQPLVEREDDPLVEPGVFNPVTSPWARSAPMLAGVWCVQARLGRPTVEGLLKVYDDPQALLEERVEEDPYYKEFMEEFEEDYPPLVFEPDGTSEWATFVLTDAPRDTDPDELEAYPRMEVIYDGMAGLGWLQRPFYEEELRMLDEHGWPPVLRKDFLTPVPLTETDVLEIQERLVRR